MACIISGEPPSAPKPGCLVCGKAQLHLTVNTQTMTLQQLLDKVHGCVGERRRGGGGVCCALTMLYMVVCF
jgi:hypothetical protein